MRFSEKSFEIRFCAALSTALMPFNRNPQWFGLTQAQERKAGIDSLLAVGGRLFIFQFKAAKDVNPPAKFELETKQWRTLTNLSQSYPNSVFYVLPSMLTVDQANHAVCPCLFEKSFIIEASHLNSCLPPLKQKTRVFTLDPANNTLKKSRSQTGPAISTVCQKMGCFCHPAHFPWPCYYSYPKDEARLVRFRDEKGMLKSVDEPLFPLPEDISGIPIGDQETRGDVPVIKSSDNFERLLGEQSNKNLGEWLCGLFLSNAKGATNK